MRFGPRQMGEGVKQLLIINAVIFVITELTGMNFWARTFGLNPQSVIFGMRIWQPFTYLFLHAGFWHLGMNMLMLWMFGSELEKLWGRKEFLRYYITTGFGAGVFSLVPYFIGVLMGYRGALPPIIGASGAVYGILLAYAMTYPDRTVLVYMIMPMKVKYLMLIMGFITFVSVGNGDGISHITHLGGLVVGWVYLKRTGKYRGLNIPWGQWWTKLTRIRVVQDEPRVKPSTKRQTRSTGSWHKVESEADLRVEMDQLLDKITQVGYEALSNKEKERLLNLSQKLSKDGNTQN